MMFCQKLHPLTLFVKGVTPHQAPIEHSFLWIQSSVMPLFFSGVVLQILELGGWCWSMNGEQSSSLWHLVPKHLSGVSSPTPNADLFGEPCRLDQWEAASLLWVGSDLGRWRLVSEVVCSIIVNEDCSVDVVCGTSTVARTWLACVLESFFRHGHWSIAPSFMPVFFWFHID